MTHTVLIDLGRSTRARPVRRCLLIDKVALVSVSGTYNASLFNLFESHFGSDGRNS